MPAASAVQPRRVIPRDSFNKIFSTLKTSAYHDPAARGSGSHTCVAIRTIDWNPTGTLVATGSVDRTLRVWNPEKTNFRQSTELRGHTSGIEKVAFNPAKECELATCSNDGTVRFWDVRTKTRIASVDVEGDPFTLSWTADGRTLLVGKDDNTLVPISVPTISTSSAKTSQPNLSSQPQLGAYQMLTSYHESQQTNGTCFTHAMQSENLGLFLTHGDGTVKIVSYPSFEPIYTLNAHTAACLSVNLSPTGRYLAVGGRDALISLWDTTDWICKRTVSSARGGNVKGLSWSWDGRFITGACDEVGCAAGLEIFHAESGESVYSTSGSGIDMGVSAVAWHPSRYLLAYASVHDVPGARNSGGLKIIGVGSSY
ncbi:hypothetical protein KEM56_007538 [Ascosphaera pollenicola]|nr:hypothetical protein KEM56_007538 [Ascosphaera pollenicola]